MKRRFTILAIFIVVISLPRFMNAQDQGFIYGKVTTVDDRTYEGPLRWGKEEVFWEDMFNSAKFKNENLRLLSRDERDELEERYHRRERYTSSALNRWFSGWESFHDRFDRDEHTHQFVCQFGELKSIKPWSRGRVDIEMQNGDKFEVSGDGYNDLGSDIQIIDPEIGVVKLSWSRIEVIEFMKAPSKLDRKFGEPLFGTVETYDNKFAGTIQWDHDERVSTDELDGDTRDSDVSIEFGNIASITRLGSRGSLVVLKSGREMDLDGSNDVDSGNRGIIVNTEFGRVDIPWREFRKVTFTDNPERELKGYDDFKSQKEMTGTVETRNGGSLTGRIVFDLDEEKDYEVLQGKDHDIEYLIPIRNVKRIAPKNYDFSTVELRNGTVLTLGEAQDVSELNTGVLVYQGNNSPRYIPWDEVIEINFN